jgi:hypothetical protein
MVTMFFHRPKISRGIRYASRFFIVSHVKPPLQPILYHAFMGLRTFLFLSNAEMGWGAYPPVKKQCLAVLPARPAVKVITMRCESCHNVP